MNVFKEEAPIEVKLRKVEALMSKLGISIEWTHRGFLVTNKESGHSGHITDLETPVTPPSTLPRMFDSEKLVIPET